MSTSEQQGEHNTSSHFELRAGDARMLLEILPADSIDAVITSPPYFGLRDYGIDGQIGAERYYPDFIDRLAAVFDQVRRVLKPDGTLWLNIGDSYATGAGAVGECPGGGEQGEKWRGYGAHGPDIKASAIGPMTQANRLPQPGLKAKDLMMIPARLAIALQASGWYLRSDILWCKPNSRPESVEDRPTKAHEHVFLFSKSERYYYDGAAIAERQSDHERARRLREQQSGLSSRYDAKHPENLPPLGHNSSMQSSEAKQRLAEKGTRNARSFWMIPAEPNKESHFAMMPVRLAERCLLAATTPGELVLDPFAGAATTGLACLKHGRRFLGFELNPEYVRLALERAREYYPLFAPPPSDDMLTR